MKSFKGIILILSLILLVGCSANSSPASPGEIQTINLDQVDEKNCKPG